MSADNKPKARSPKPKGRHALPKPQRCRQVFLEFGALGLRFGALGLPALGFELLLRRQPARPHRDSERDHRCRFGVTSPLRTPDMFDGNVEPATFLGKPAPRPEREAVL